MNYDLDDMLSYKIKLMFYRIIGLFIVALIILFIYGLIKPKNPKDHDGEIIKSAELSCIWEKKLEKAQIKIDKCLENKFALTKKQDLNAIESCKKIGYDYAEISYQHDGSMYSSALEDIEDFRAEAELPLSNGSKYISSCKKDIIFLKLSFI